MKAVILAGGLGTRLSEETTIKPKPMVEIGSQPILWHIMKIYSHYGINDFVICLGYRGYLIKEYFRNYMLHTSDVTINLRTDEMTVHRRTSEPWTVTLVDTGDSTMTGGRIRRVKEHVQDGAFCLTYGDGVSDVNIASLIEFHKANKGMATLTAVQPPGRFGVLTLDGPQVVDFHEKPVGETGWINGGFFVLEPEAIDYIEGDGTHWEREPMEQLAQANQLFAYKHHGFWHPMDTLRDKTHLEGLWSSGAAPWKSW